jgi:RNA polymerase sigma-70 factor (ECF subfamily)
MEARRIAAEPEQVPLEHLDEARLVALAVDRHEGAIRLIIQRHNQRLFRTARSVLRNDAEAEDVVQETYLKAFTNLATFRGDSQLSTWLTRIALNAALERIRRRRPTADLEQIDVEANRPGGRILAFPTTAFSAADPETETSRHQVRQLLERAVDDLPGNFRAVFVLRDVEGMSIDETAEQLQIKPETVKTRLHRARKMLRATIEAEFAGAFAGLFPFDGARCVHMADRVIAQLHDRGNTAA